MSEVAGDLPPKWGKTAGTTQTNQDQIEAAQPRRLPAVTASTSAAQEHPLPPPGPRSFHPPAALGPQCPPPPGPLTLPVVPPYPTRRDLALGPGSTREGRRARFPGPSLHCSNPDFNISASTAF
nr:MAPK-interacting and spindle-stabilizing protein-like [Kogia breviceps]